MTDILQSFAVRPTAYPTNDTRRAQILADPMFGQHHTDHMVSIAHSTNHGWHDAQVTAYGPIEFDPSALVLHYCQQVFEGLKAFRWSNGAVMSFRPEANAARMQASAKRLVMPVMPTEVFIESLRQLIAIDIAWVPSAESGKCLYLRPFIVATEPTLELRASRQYRYFLIASPTGAGFQRRLRPVSVWLSTDYVRACPGGTGAFKVGANYAASMIAQAEAAQHECDQVVWVDALERRYIEEMGGMNLFFVYGSGPSARLITPKLTGSILPGITRHSLLQMAFDSGMAVEERRIDIDEWCSKAATGELTEVFACGTAAVVTPVSKVKYGDNEFEIADGQPGKVTMAMRNTLTGIQHGTLSDPHRWMSVLS